MKIDGYSRTKTVRERVLLCLNQVQNRAVFNRLSKVMGICFVFVLLSSAVGTKKTAPLSQPIKSETKTNPDLLTFRARFVLGVGYMYMFVLLNGLLRCLCLL